MIFFLQASKYRCYFCSFKCNELDECVNHSVTHHSDKQVTIRTYVLDTVSGLLGYQTKRYPVVPDNLPNDKFVGVIGDKVKKCIPLYTPVLLYKSGVYKSHGHVIIMCLLFLLFETSCQHLFVQTFWDDFLGLTSSKQNG